MKVRRQPVDPGPAAWNALLEPAGPAQELEGAQTADFLVIGAGFAGLAAARRLWQMCPGAAIKVLEARRVAEGPAGRNSGVMVDLPHDLTSQDYAGGLEADRAQIRTNRHAIDFAADSAREYGLGQEAFNPCGKINGAASPAGLRHNADFSKHLQALGEPHEMLDGQAMADLTGTRFYQGGLFTPGTVILQPAAYVRGVAAGLARSGVEIFENSGVLSLERDVDWVATTARGRVTAPRVILAVNGHLNSFGKHSGRLMHVFTYASMTRALSADQVARLGGAAHWALTPADPMGTTVRRITGQGGARIVIRNRFTFDPGMEVRASRIDRVARDHDRAFARRFPMLAGVEMEYRWGGRLCLSRNGVQVIGALEPGLVSASCQNGLGTAKGTFAGMMAAEIAADSPSELAREAMAADQPSRLPPRPIAWLGANAVIRWQERRAGREL